MFPDPPKFKHPEHGLGIPLPPGGFGFPGANLTGDGLSGSGLTATRPGAAGARPASWSPAVPGKPTPLPKRPKGRFFVGTLVLSAMLTLAYFGWASLFRYRAYGVVVGRVVQVAAPWDGAVRTQFVREGDRVRSGDPLLELDRHETQRAFDRTADELRLAQAELEAEVARLRFESQSLDERREKAQAEYYELWGTLLKEQAQHDETLMKLRRSQALLRREATSNAEHEAVLFAENGQRSRIEKLKTALDRLKDRVEMHAEAAAADHQRLAPRLVRLDTLRSELERLRGDLDEARVRSPLAGTVIRCRRFAGEYAEQADPLVEILEDGATEILLCVPQHEGEDFSPGARCELELVPRRGRFVAEVARIGAELAPPPPTLERRCGSRENLLHVYLRPLAPEAADQLRLGGEVRAPRDLPRWTRFGLSFGDAAQ